MDLPGQIHSVWPDGSVERFDSQRPHGDNFCGVVSASQVTGFIVSGFLCDRILLSRERCLLSVRQRSGNQVSLLPSGWQYVGLLDIT